MTLEPVEGVRVGDEAAFTVLQHDRDLLTGGVVRRPSSGRVVDPQALVHADELAAVVADQGARQQVRLAQDLEAVADPQNGHATSGRLDHLGHHRSEAGDRAAAQVVAVGEAAGKDYSVHTAQVMVAVPQRDRLGAGQRHRALRVDVVERTGKGDDPDPHAVASATWTV
jgi:hypothetical protein